MLGRRKRKAPEFVPTGPLVLVVTNDDHISGEATLGFPPDYKVEVVRDARAAVDALARMTPSCMVVDLQSGSAGGYALLKDVEQIPRLDGVPVLMLVRRWEDSWLAKQAGAARVCRKPIATADLVRETIALATAKRPA